jgi:hypothetical protein
MLTASSSIVVRARTFSLRDVASPEDDVRQMVAAGADGA